MAGEASNLLYYGDNLHILREYVKDESVDLVYLDPPFNSNQTYNVLFAERDGARSTAQLRAFEDTWEWGDVAARTYYEVTMRGGSVGDALEAFHRLLGTNNMLAYLVMMAPRLVELRRVLKPTGSIYLHCDPTASHYLKMLMDAIFGAENFRNEIIWKRTTAHSSAKRYGPVHDVLLFYTRSAAYRWMGARADYEQAYLDHYYKYDDGDGRLYWRADLCAAGVRNGRSGMPWRGIDPSAKGMHWKFTIDTLDQLDAEGRIYWPPNGIMPQYKRYQEELKGKAVSDVWDDIDRINPVGNERLGYPTQKPEALLERILEASTRAGDTILDPFCGCGTAIAAAQRLKRRWIGIDITTLATSLIKKRLRDAYGGDIDTSYQVIGEPVTLSEAEALANEPDRYQFQWWALGLVEAAGEVSERKKGADRGIDGRLPFQDDATGKVKHILLSVKSGKPKMTDVTSLRGVVEREKAEIGVLITMHPPTKPMQREAAEAGFYRSPWKADHPHPRLQILTVAELLEGKRIDMPPVRQVGRSYKRAPKAQRIAEVAQLALLDGIADEG